MPEFKLGSLLDCTQSQTIILAIVGTLRGETEYSFIHQLYIKNLIIAGRERKSNINMISVK